MNTKAYISSTQLSLGEVKTELKPDKSFDSQRQALDAMLVTAHSTLSAWVIDNTTDPETHGGKQEKITAQVMDNGQKIADIVLSVPTTSNYSKGMFESFLVQTIVPQVMRTAKSYPSTRVSSAKAASSQSSLSQQTLAGALQETSRINPRQLQSH